jgi:hypothetical protein
MLIDTPVDIALRDLFALKSTGARLRNCLHNEGVQTLGELLDMSGWKLRATPNLGGKTIKLLLTWLDDRGLKIKDDPCYIAPRKGLSQAEAKSAAQFFAELWLASERDPDTHCSIRECAVNVGLCERDGKPNAAGQHVLDFASNSEVANERERRTKFIESVRAANARGPDE